MPINVYLHAFTTDQEKGLKNRDKSQIHFSHLINLPSSKKICKIEP